MATTYDLTAPKHAELKFEEATIRVNLLKRKDATAFSEKQKEARESGKNDFDIIQLIAPFVFDEDREKFMAITEDMVLWQINRLAEVFFEMNGIDIDEAKRAADRAAEKGA